MRISGNSSWVLRSTGTAKGMGADACGDEGWETEETEETTQEAGDWRKNLSAQGEDSRTSTTEKREDTAEAAATSSQTAEA